MSAEEEEAQKARLKTSWELITILDFLSIFQPYLRLEHLQFSADELASALILNNGTSGLLPELHIVRGTCMRCLGTTPAIEAPKHCIRSVEPSWKEFHPLKQLNSNLDEQ